MQNRLFNHDQSYQLVLKLDKNNSNTGGHASAQQQPSNFHFVFVVTFNNEFYISNNQIVLFLSV